MDLLFFSGSSKLLAGDFELDLDLELDLELDLDLFLDSFDSFDSSFSDNLPESDNSVFFLLEKNLIKVGWLLLALIVGKRFNLEKQYGWRMNLGEKA